MQNTFIINSNTKYFVARQNCCISMAKLNNILLPSGTSSPTAIRREGTASYQGNNGYAKAPQGNVESTFSCWSDKKILCLHQLPAYFFTSAPTTGQVNWSLAIL
jgi:hypothetical protein